MVTLHEKSSSTSTHYLFVFTHATTKQVVAFVKAKASDESQYVTRYNLYTIDITDVFDGAPVGEYLYKVYEQTSNSNTDPALAGNEVENGKMFLSAATAFSYDTYNTATTYKQYNG